MQTSTPLSFSQHYHQSLEYLVEQALLSLACPPEKLTGFRSHSSIHLEFDSLPNITLSIENDRLWLWSAFNDLTAALITQQAAEIFTLLQEPIPFLELEQAMLVKTPTGYELKALVDIACLHSPQNLGTIIEYFYQKIDAICHIFTSNR
ncbi:InvB/SpaK family type III secretion system chaperone [Shewanella surugensis]|uniref:Uncharacterized protein n=1 Tax=Shewanella surugensis TaxID=212020 RepID=A0ABT0L658_9GAMM|nr:hypothetical protein [Shewanella surugensis]MCL1123164.1 hypothetical protein [Shewanella surugensis]